MVKLGWIKHDGKGYPRHLVGRKITKRYSDGEESTGCLISCGLSDVLWKWDTMDPNYDIIEYKVVS